MCRLKGASLVEAIVGALVFLVVFATAMELIPRLTLRSDDAVLLVEADYRVSRAAEKYATGLWPCGEYAEEYDWGTLVVKILPYREFSDLQQLEIRVCIDGSRRKIFRRQLIKARL